jgi:outer membrane protein assembly factor BamB
MAAALVIVLGAGGGWLARHLVFFRDVAMPETVYVSPFAPWMPWIAVTALIAGWWSARAWTCGRHPLSAVLCGTFAVVLTIGITADVLLSHSPYLAYQLVSIPLQSGKAATWPAALIPLLVISWLRHRRRARGQATPPDARQMSAALALALGAIAFVQANYVHPNSQMHRAIVSVDRASGAINWIVRGLEDGEPAIDGRNSPATPTAVTDGAHVCGYFGTAGLMCSDGSGRLLWSRTNLQYENIYGVGTSPVLADGVLVIARDQPDGSAAVEAMDVRTGKALWTHTFATTPTLSGNSRTPLIRDIHGRRVLILWGMFYLRALALQTGALLWRSDVVSGGDLVSSAISDERHLYLSDATGTIAVDYLAAAAGGHAVRWASNARANCASPVLVRGLLLTVTDSGIATAVRSATGETVWRRRLPGHYFASPIASPDAAYFTNSDGLTTIVALDDFRVIAQNDLGEETLASIATAGGELFIRSTAHLYAVHGY